MLIHFNPNVEVRGKFLIVRLYARAVNEANAALVKEFEETWPELNLRVVSSRKERSS